MQNETKTKEEKVEEIERRKDEFEETVRLLRGVRRDVLFKLYMLPLFHHDPLGSRLEDLRAVETAASAAEEESRDAPQLARRLDSASAEMNHMVEGVEIAIRELTGLVDAIAKVGIEVGGKAGVTAS